MRHSLCASRSSRPIAIANDPGRRALASRASTGEDRVVTADVESALLRRDVKRHQGDGNIDVEKHSALQAMNVVMPFDSAVVPACLIGEGQLLDQPVLREQMQRTVDRAVGDARIAPPHALEYLARGQVVFRPADLIEHFRPLRCISESLPRHHTAKM